MALHATSIADAPPSFRAGNAPDLDRNYGDPEYLGILCRLVVKRRSRLQRLLQMRAPDLIVRNEKRMLRAATDALVEHCIAAAVAADDGAVGTVH